MEDPYHEKKNVVNHKTISKSSIFDRFLPKGRRLSLFNGIVETILGVSRSNLNLLNMFQFLQLGFLVATKICGTFG